MSGEQLFGTAPEARAWLLLENTSRWDAKALAGSSLPDEVRAKMAAYDARPGLRVQLITQPQRRRRQDRLRLFLARPDLGALWSWDLEDYAQIPDNEIEEFLDRSEARPVPVPLQLFVCTNGRRDICCAIHGMPVFLAARDALGERAWQTTHLGGHRFAGTAICFPSGRVYGRLGSTCVAQLIQGEASGTIHLDRYRGDSRYSAAVQAAEYYLRREVSGGAPVLRATQHESGDRLRVTFALAGEHSAQPTDAARVAQDAARNAARVAQDAAHDATSVARDAAHNAARVAQDATHDATHDAARVAQGAAHNAVHSAQGDDSTPAALIDVVVQSYTPGFSVIKTSGDPEPSSVRQFRLVSIART